MEKIITEGKEVPVNHTGLVISVNAPKWAEAAVKLGYRLEIAPTDEKPNEASDDKYHKFTVKRETGGPYLNDLHEEFDQLLHK